VERRAGADRDVHPKATPSEADLGQEGYPIAAVREALAIPALLVSGEPLAGAE
jgi:hypothetical protein